MLDVANDSCGYGYFRLYGFVHEIYEKENRNNMIGDGGRFSMFSVYDI